MTRYFVGSRKKLDELIPGKVGEIVESHYLVLSERDQHAGRQPFERSEFVADTKLLTPLLVLTVPPFERAARSVLQFCRHLGVETFNVREVLQRNVSHLLERGEALGNQQVGDDIVNIEGIDKHLAAAAEFLSPPLGLLGLGQDVDIPARKLRRETNILAPSPDR